MMKSIPLLNKHQKKLTLAKENLVILQFKVMDKRNLFDMIEYFTAKDNSEKKRLSLQYIMNNKILKNIEKIPFFIACRKIFIGGHAVTGILQNF